MGEFELIQKFKRVLGKPSKNILVGIGDDTLVDIPPKNRLLWTVDCVVEKIHFDFKYCTPEEVGWKALAVNLSDIAAMGGKSLYALVSLAIPTRVSEKKLLGVYEGIKKCALWSKVDVVGGNVSKSRDDFVIDITVVGEANKPILRSGAKAGQGVAITGFPGLSAAGFYAFQKWGRAAYKKFPLSCRRHVLPEPRVEWAKTLAQLGVSSLIDVSDGLSSELHHLSQESKVGFEIDERLLPLNEEILRLSKTLDKDPLQLMLHGGEQYELLMTFPISKFSKISTAAYQNKIPFTMIGFTQGSSYKVTLRNRLNKVVNLKPRGWTHF
ncbi:MAG: thiamine-phosphate kinase [Deltaproteobacteria bacterium]